MSSSTTGTSTQGSAGTAGSAAKAILSPFGVLLLVYFAYFGLVYSQIYKYAYWELMTLGTRIIGFHPSGRTLALYVYGGLVLVFGFAGGALLSRWVSAEHGSRAAGKRILGAVDRTGERLGKLPVFRTLGVPYTLSLALWSLGFLANLAQIAQSGISIADIATRWQQSPILVWFAASQILSVPALVVWAKGKKLMALTVLLFVLSTLALGLLGARNLPSKLIVATFLAVVYIIKPKYLWRIAAVFLVLLVLAMAIVGAVSKSGIYGPTASAGLALALTYSDSAGTAYNLDRIVALTPPTGVYNGRLLRDSALALIPRSIYGGKADYANFQLGKYLSGRKYFLINGELIDRSVSLAPALIGAPYADWGVAGVAGQMALLGMLFGYLQRRGRRAPWVIPVLAMYASYVINGVNAGVHNPQAITWTALAFIVMIVDMILGRAQGALPAKLTEELR